jgi:hypothetical protein
MKIKHRGLRTVKRILICIAFLLLSIGQLLASNVFGIPIANINNTTGKSLYLKTQQDALYEQDGDSDNPLLSRVNTTILKNGSEKQITEPSVIYLNKNKQGWFVGIDETKKRVSVGSNLYNCLNTTECDEIYKNFSTTPQKLIVSDNIKAKFYLDNNGLIQVNLSKTA